MTAPPGPWFAPCHAVEGDDDEPMAVPVNAIKIEADADAYANKKIAESISAPLLSLRHIEVQGKFNEALRENHDAKIFLTPGGAVPNIWLDSKDGQKAASVSK